MCQLENVSGILVVVVCCTWKCNIYIYYRMEKFIIKQKEIRIYFWINL